VVGDREQYVWSGRTSATGRAEEQRGQAAALAWGCFLHTRRGCFLIAVAPACERFYSGNGLSFVSGANGNTKSPITKISDVITPAFCRPKDSVSCPTTNRPAAVMYRATL